MNSVRLLCIGFLVAASGVASAQPETGFAESQVEVDGVLQIPKWRFSANPFGFSSSIPSLSLHRALGQRTDIGFSVAAHFNESARDDEQLYREFDAEVRAWDRDSDHFNAALVLSAELRRWREVSSRISWFYGLRGGYGYSYSERENRVEYADRDDDETDLTEIESWDHSTYGAMIIGVDLELIEHLSFAVGLTPIRATYFWGTDQWDSELDSTDEFRSRITWEDEEFDRFEVRLDSAVAGYVSLWF